MNLKEITSRHPYGFKGILRNYPYEKLKYSVILSVIVSIVLTILISISKNELKSIVELLIASSFTILPNLIGFVLAGFAIIVGFGNKDFLIYATIPGTNGKSLYQTYSYIYSFGLFILILNLGVAFIFHLISMITIYPKRIEWSSFGNIIGVFILVFLMTLSILTLFYMVVNVFNLSQSHHLSLTIEREREEEGK